MGPSWPPGGSGWQSGADVYLCVGAPNRGSGSSCVRQRRENRQWISWKRTARLLQTEDRGRMTNSKSSDEPAAAREVAELMAAAMHDVRALGFSEESVLAGSMAAATTRALLSRGAPFAAQLCDRAGDELRGIDYAA